MVQHWLSGLQLSFMEVKYSFGLLKTDLKSFPPSQLSASVLEDELAKKNKTPLTGTELILCFNSLFSVLCLQLGICATQQDFN